MSIIISILSAVGGYLIGAISFSRIAGKILAPEKNFVDLEIPSQGTDETHRVVGIGASNLGMILGEKVGCIVGLIDMAKIFVPTLILKLVYPEQPYHLIAATTGMIGHNWPVYYRFKGGHGISSIYGGLLAIDWLGAIITPTAGLIFGLFVLRDFMFAYLSGTWLLIPWLWFRTHDFAHLLYGIAVNIIFILAMIPEIKQAKKHAGIRQEKADLRTAMDQWPMGRSILKLTDRLKISIK
jgi:glycerol-3-phosphate acyltransferase PlsY